MNVSHQAHGERNYHVFYELLAGLPMEQKEEMYLQEAESYFYLNQVSELRVLCSREKWPRHPFCLVREAPKHFAPLQRTLRTLLKSPLLLLILP